MFKRLFKAIPVAIMATITLTSCTFLDNLIGTILVNAAMNMPMLVNGINVMSEDEDEFMMAWDPMPTEAKNRQNLSYLTNVLVVPQSIKAEVFGLNINVKFEAKFISDKNVDDAFKKVSLKSDDLPDGLDIDFSSLPFPVEFALDVYIPVGDSDILDDVNSIADLESLVEEKSAGDLLAATDQEELDFKLQITGKSGSTSKQKSFYFKLIRPEIGEMIFEPLLDSGYLINIFHFETNGEQSYNNLTNLPTDPNNPYLIEYLKDTIVIPQFLTIKDVGDVQVTTNLSVVGNHDYFFESHITKSLEDIMGDDDSEIDLIEGDISVATFTAIGNYDKPAAGTTIEEFSREIEDAISDETKLKKLYAATQLAELNFSIDVHIDVIGYEYSDTYYFKLKNPNFDREIIDFAADSEYVLYHINYNDVSHPTSIADRGQSSNDPIVLEYLTDTIGVPSSVKLEGFDTRALEFDVSFPDNPEYSDLFFSANHDLADDEIDLKGADVTVETLTPIGDYGGKPKPTPGTTIEAFSDEIQDMFDNDVKTLHKIISQPATAPFKMEVSISLPAKDNGERVAPAIKTYWIKIIQTDIDQEIVDFVKDQDALLSVVNYEAFKEDDYESKIANIGNAATSENDPYVIEHMVDTLVLPQEITLTEFGNKTISVVKEIKNVNGTLSHYEGIKKDLSFDEGKYLIDAETITPLGGYTAKDTTHDLDEFSKELEVLTTKDLYDYSQAPDVSFTLELTITIINNELARPNKTVTKSFYIKVVKPDVDKDIPDYIFDNHPVIYKLDTRTIKDEISQEALPMDTSPTSRYELSLFDNSLIMPASFTFNDFGERTLTFNVTGLNESKFIRLTKDEYQYEDALINALTLTPIGDYEPGTAFTTLEELVDHIESPANLGAIIASNNTAEPFDIDLVITISLVTPEGKRVSASRTYYLRVVPADLGGIPLPF